MISKQRFAQHLHLGFSGSPFYIASSVDNTLFTDPARPPVDYDQFLVRFNATMEIKGRPLVLGLTGGWDTRLILSALVANNTPDPSNIHCFTAATNESDVSVASAICRDFGIDHRVYRNEGAALTDGNLTNFFNFNQIAHSSARMASDFPQDKCFISGGYGNEIWRARFQSRVRRHVRESHSLSRGLFRAFSLSLNMPRIPPIYTFDVEKTVSTLIERQLKQAPSFAKKDTAWLTDWFVWQNFQPARSSVADRLTADDILCTPFRNPELVKYVYRLPVQDRIDATIYKYIMEHNCPELLRYPFNPPCSSPEVVVPQLPPYEHMRTREYFKPKQLAAYLADHPDPLWVQALASMELYLAKEAA